MEPVSTKRRKKPWSVTGFLEGNLWWTIEIRWRPFRIGSRHGNCSKQRKPRTERWRRARVQRVVTPIGPCLHACVRWHALGLQVPRSRVVAPQPTTRTISKITGDSRNYPALSRYAFLCRCIRAGVTPTGFSVIFNPGPRPSYSPL